MKNGRERTCRSKVAYKTAAAARRAAHYVRLGKYTNVYQCPVCRDYHLGGGGTDGDERRKR